ncbi:MAG: sigma-70 family RNA polymerase sigma factor, partial [Candidatus Amulumruptor sp.]|nr:sigma-70 family RNA polymerase sigma factor [Candidatus Amulumruptor sp.]
MQTTDRLPDDRLVAAYAAGDNRAFDILLSRHQQRIFAYILSVVRNRDVANDIFQDTFVKAITTISQGRYNETGKFSAWLTRIAHNLIIDYFRFNKSENTVSIDDVEIDWLNRRELAEGTAEDVMRAVQTTDEILSRINDLPDKQQDV